VRLSQMNYGIDTGIFPLGSCTMKHNARLNERMARLPGISDIHPLQPVSTVQGALERDEMIPEHSIQVAVSNGWVALNGRVERPREREEAERIARRTAGVRGVYNLIEVSPPAIRVERTLDAAAVTVQPLAANLQSAPPRVA